MSTGQWLALAALVLLLLAGALFYAYRVGAFTTWVVAEPKPVQQTQVQQAEPSFKPLPVDPTNPPTFRNYAPRPGSEPRLCACHHRPLEPGPVLWWPLPEPTGGVWLICRESYEGMEVKAPHDDDHPQDE